MTERQRISHLLVLYISYPLVPLAARISVRAALESNTNVDSGNVLYEEPWQKDLQYACVQKWHDQKGRFDNKYCLTNLKLASDITSDHLNFAADVNICQDEKQRHKMKLCPLKGERPHIRISYTSKKLLPKSCFRVSKNQQLVKAANNKSTIRISRFAVLEAAISERDCEEMTRASVESQNIFAALVTTTTTTRTTTTSVKEDNVDVDSHRIQDDFNEDHFKHDIDEEYYENVGIRDDCVGWGYVGVCTKCLADTSSDPVWATCYECPPGYALHRASPENAGFSEDNGLTVHMRTQCVALAGEERRLIMIRHGESVWNEMMKSTHKAATAVGLWIGKDSPLSPLGLRQAQRLANVIKKTNEKVYGEVGDGIDSYLSNARLELDDVDLEEVMIIKEKSSGRKITDKEMVDNLSKEENREELDVLLGRRCEDTTFVSSQLARAMDTLVIGTMESRIKCKSPWAISSNLQEIEHNIDCTPKNPPRRQPVMGNRQRKSYASNNMRKTEEYIEDRYSTSDVSRFVKNLGARARARWNDQTPQMRNELGEVFRSSKMFTVWGGHSIWFRHFFIEFVDLSNPICKQLTEIKLTNTAMVSVRVREVETASSNVGYAIYDCKFIHLGSSKEYKLKLSKNDTANVWKIPHPSHFDHGIQQINGWKCCCSRSDYRDAPTWTYARSLETCVLVRTDKCSQPDVWHNVWNRNDSFIQEAKGYDWGHNKGPCTVA